MADSFEVASAALHNHASVVTGLADELRSAFDVAGHVTLTSDAYGQTCAQVVSMLNAVAEAAGKVVQGGIDALDGTAAKLRASATAYTEVDTGKAGTFSGITEELP